MTINILIVSLLLICLCGCGSDYDAEAYRKLEDVRTELAAGLSSYINFEEAKKILNLRESDYVVLEDSQSKKSPDIPPFNIYTIKIPGGKVSGYTGDLVLSFFNGRLMETRFYPIRLSAFIHDLGLDVDTLSKSKDIKPHTNVWLEKDFEDNTYIGWEDVRLKEQFNSWIKDYS